MFVRKKKKMLGRKKKCSGWFFVSNIAWSKIELSGIKWITSSMSYSATLCYFGLFNIQ